MKKLLLIIILFLTPLYLLSQTQIGTNIKGEAAGDLFGYSVSLSSDGTIIAIGGYSNDENGKNSGHVRILKNTDGSWTQIGTDINGEAEGDAFGYSVSLSSNGNIVAISGVHNDKNGLNSGHVRVFSNTNGTWEQIGVNINGEATDDYFGSSISLSSDGTIVAIGAAYNDGLNGTSTNSGHVRVFRNNNGVWEQIGADINGRGTEDNSGEAVSLSADGTTVAIGSWLSHTSSTIKNSGNVRVFRNNNGIWEQLGTDINGEAAGDVFGLSVSLSSDGNIFAAGAAGNNAGYIKVFKNNNGVWEQIGTNINGEANGDYFGESISLSSDGSIVAVGADKNDGNGINSGHVRVFKNNSGTWKQIGVDIDGAAAGDKSGISSISLSSTGSIVSIGSVLNITDGIKSGHVRVFNLSSVLKTTDFLISKFRVYPNPIKKYFQIELNDGILLKKVKIYNSLGQFIKSEEKLKISTLNFKKGIYFIKIITNKGQATKKIILE
jgi:hypothetical protein